MRRQQHGQQFLRLVEAQAQGTSGGGETTQAVWSEVHAVVRLTLQLLNMATQVSDLASQGVAVGAGLSGLLYGGKDGVGMEVSGLPGAVGSAGLGGDVAVGATQDSGGVADADDSG